MPQNRLEQYDYISTALLNFVISGGFYQFVNFPTRGDNILDLVLIDDDQIVSNIIASPPVGHSDHCIVDFTIVMKCSESCGMQSPNCTKKRYKWFKADFDGIAHYLHSVDWDSLICNNPSALSCWSAFIRILWTAVNIFVPYPSTTLHKVGKKLYPRTIRKLTARKRNLWKKCRANPADLSARWKYRDCTNMLRAQCRELIIKQEERVTQSNNLGAFYKHVNNRILYRGTIDALLEEKGNIVTSDELKANLFNDYYATVGVIDNGNIPCCSVIELNSILETVSFDEPSVVAAINKLKSNLSSGPDDLPPVLFKELKYCLARPSSLICYPSELSLMNGLKPSSYLCK